MDIKVQFAQDLKFIKEVNPVLYEKLREDVQNDRLSKISEVRFHSEFHRLRTREGIVRVVAEVITALAAIYYNLRHLGHIFTQLELFEEEDAIRPLKGVVEGKHIEAFKAFFKNTTPLPGSPEEMWEQIKKYILRLPARRAPRKRE